MRRLAICRLMTPYDNEERYVFTSQSDDFDHSRRARRGGRRLTSSPAGRAGAVLASLCAAVTIAACGSSSTGSNGSKAASHQVPLSAHQTISWAIAGGISNNFGSEAQASKAQIAAFEHAHPNIKVHVVALSEDADTGRATIDRDFVAGSSTPDVIDASTDWIGEMANAGYLLDLTPWKMTGFLPKAVASTSFNHRMYGALWYFNAEGLYYNKKLIKTPPKTPSQLVADAKAAMKADPKLKEGIAFEGDKYEGFVTFFIDLMRAFGGSFDPAHFDTPQNQAALQFLHDMVYKYKVASTAASQWQETQTDNAFQSGQAAFEVNWPYVQQEDFAKSKTFPLSGQHAVGFEPFPTQNGRGTSTVAANALVVNAKSKHVAADEALIKFMMSPKQQIARAITSGDPPSVSAAYSPALFKKAPYFRADLKVFKVGYPRLVNAHYSQISSDVQDMLSSVLANNASPGSALKSTAAQIASLGAS